MGSERLEAQARTFAVPAEVFLVSGKASLMEGAELLGKEGCLRNGCGRIQTLFRGACVGDLSVHADREALGSRLRGALAADDAAFREAAQVVKGVDFLDARFLDQGEAAKSPLAGLIASPVLDRRTFYSAV